MKRKKRSSLPKATQAGTVRIGDVLPQLIARYGLQKSADIERLEEAWQEAVGSPFNAVSRVLRLSRGTLEVAVPHNAFAQELSFQQETLLRKLHDHLGDAVTHDRIKKIKFVVQAFR